MEGRHIGFIRDLTGATQVDAATQAGDIQRQQALTSAQGVAESGDAASDLIGRALQGNISRTSRTEREAGALLEPFAQAGQQGVDLAGFLGDPQAQFDFLQSNPLFQSALESANRRTERSAASGGRLTAGDTLEQLTANTLQTAAPLIDRQRADILNLLNLGRGVATEQGNIIRGSGDRITGLRERGATDLAGILRGTAADVANLETGGAASQAAGVVGAANARGDRAGNLLDIGGLLAGGIF